MHRLEDRGILENNLSMEQITAIRTAEYALDELYKSKDVQPVSHGRWLPSDSYITTAYGTIHCQKCSECLADIMEDNDYDYDFCPVCGTIMDGDRNG